MPADSKKQSIDIVRVDPQALMLRKPVQAIHMAIVGSKQSRTQRLAFNAMLKHAHQVQNKNPDHNLETFEMSRKELMETIGYTSPNRKHLKKLLDDMQMLRVQWDILEQGGAIWKSTVMMPHVEVHPDKVVYGYASQIKRELFNPEIYAMLDLRIQRKFSLDCTAALYEWVTRYRKTGRTAEMPWEQWRWTIYGYVDEKSTLNEYKIFKRDKLKPAIEEINRVSDLTIALHENKDGGRSVKLLQFSIEEKPMFIEHAAAAPDTTEWDHRLDEVGVSVKDRKRILRKYSAEVIEAHYNYTMKRVQDTRRAPLGNIGAYLLHALDNGYAMDMVKREQAPATPATAVGMEQLMIALKNSRNSEAAAMFAEMPADDQEGLITAYNALQTLKGAHIPDTESKRVARVMVPFYAWVADTTWGQPDLKEVFEFGLKQGLIQMTPEMAAMGNTAG